MDAAAGGARRLLVGASVAAWLLVAAPTALTSARSPRFPYWLAACLAFGAALAVVSDGRTPPRARDAARLAQSASVVVMVALLCNGFEGALLALIAAELASGPSRRRGLAWIGAQTVATAVAIGLHWSPRPALLLMPPYLGVQLFAFLTLRLAAQEASARRALARSHAELLRLQDELAQRARRDERIRLAQELHDVLGHHLTAMSLNLEAAAHESAGPAREGVRAAQSLVRVLLHDVKEIVGALKEAEDVDLARELERLAREIPSPRIHVAVAPGVEPGSQQRSRAVLRCVQEIVTNAIRHGRARNVWISLGGERGALSLSARDDGDGAAEFEDGVGLSGMRRRIEELGGTLDVEAGRPAGFALRASLPAEAAP